MFNNYSSLITAAGHLYCVGLVTQDKHGKYPLRVAFLPLSKYLSYTQRMTYNNYRNKQKCTRESFEYANLTSSY